MPVSTNRGSLTQAYLKSRLVYDPESGDWYWLEKEGNDWRTRAWNTRYAYVGNTAGHFRGDYWVIRLDGELYLAHVLAWLYIYGIWPHKSIDHGDQVKHHNWISNLSLATTREQSQNMPNNIMCEVDGVSVSFSKVYNTKHHPTVRYAQACQRFFTLGWSIKRSCMEPVVDTTAYVRIAGVDVSFSSLYKKHHHESVSYDCAQMRFNKLGWNYKRALMTPVKVYSSRT